MVELTGYQILEQVYAGTRTLVYRGIREQDQKPVVIKLMRSEYPSFGELVQFRNQYTIAKNLDLPGIVRPYSLENYHNSYALVMEDFGGISLVETLHATSLQDFFHIAIQIVSTLDGLYRNRVIHKDIKPANILINPSTGEVRLIDFSIASLLPRETQTLTSPNVLEGTLAYLSPEQTGRMNRGIDYRSDFYSLGVTFFELLTGKLPFQSDDPMELVHCHIAKLPPSAHSLNPDIPPILSEMIAKLMAKNAHIRYQSALGLKHDLEVCLHQLQTALSITRFELGTQDISDRFIIPEKLYGREAEVEALLAAFERVAAGGEEDTGTRGRGDAENFLLPQSKIQNPKSKIEMVLVAGFSGIGKTAIVNEVHKPIVRARGYFIKGKYDQFGRNIPFSAFVQAFRDLIGQLLSESEAQLQQWKSKILSAVGVQGKVIIDVIPELERIIGPQPPVAELSGSAATNRFNLLFQKFIQVFTTKEHPLVMFLDDLQWADSASLNLMQLLMSDDTKHLLIIGAYRDNEVASAHPLMLTLSEIRKCSKTVNTITLAPLKQTDLNHLVADTLCCSLELAQPLTQLVFQKTQGNPFFANQFLKALHEDGLITFNLNGGYWECNLAQVKALALTDDVVEFMALQLQKLPQETQEVLKLAACIGNSFDLATLSIVNEKSQAETATDLWKALQEGLVFPTSEVYKFYQNGNGELGIGLGAWGMGVINNAQCPMPNAQCPNYKFLHDRVQQAAYSLIPEHLKQSTHLKIGQLLLINTPEAQREEKIFEIVNHLNIGADLITNQVQREELAQWNLIAGRKAKASTAYGAAVKYLTLGIEMLAGDALRECRERHRWQNKYNLTLALHEEAVEAAYLSTDFSLSEQLASVVLAQAKTLLDKMKTYQIRVEAYKAQTRNLEAITTGLEVLKLFGIDLPEQPTPADIELALQETQLGLAGKQIEDLIDLPVMTDPAKLALMSFLGRLLSITYMSNPPMFPLVVAQQINLSLKYGNCAVSASSYITYGMILLNISGDIDASYRFGQLALNLLARLNAKEIKSIVIFVFNTFIRHWKEHLGATLNSLLEAYSIGLETGDSENAAFSTQLYSEHSFWLGKNLVELERKIANYHDAIGQLKQSRALQNNAIYWQAVLNLLRRSENLCCLRGEIYDEQIMLPLHQQVNNKEAIFSLHLQKLFFSYLFQDYSQAEQNICEGEDNLDAVQARVLVAVFNFYSSLTRLAIYADNQSEQNQTFKKVLENQKKMKKWADYAPMNYLHKYYLVEAELHRVLGENVEAMEMYDRAISKAKENEYLNEEAIACELAAKFYLEWGKEIIAQTYLIKAYYAYSLWGASAKVEDLEKRYPQLLAPILQRQSTLLNPTETISTLTGKTVTSTTSVSDVLDLASVIKANQTLSGEIQLDKLLTRLMQVVIENAGASSGALMLLKDNKLVIEAIVSGEKISNVGQSIPVEDAEIPVTIINYVSRTLETLVIDDVTTENSIADPYIIRSSPLSLLCSPLLNQGKLIGILYLENNLTTSAFTSDRLTVINLLCSQAAICLENARLYQQSQEYAQQLEQSLDNLQQMQLQLVQSEKMSALGNLVAGVAHEINNPVGFIAGNLQPAVDYVNDLFGLIDLYEQKFPSPGDEIESEIETIDLEYLRKDLPNLINSMKEGVSRICHISNSLRIFSRADSVSKVPFNIHEGIDSTIMILKHRLKASEARQEIKVVRDYGDLPQVECFPGQLNQVFMNLLANAIDAIEESGVRSQESGVNEKTTNNQQLTTNNQTIRIHTQLNSEKTGVVIQIQDNGVGMSKEVQQKVFEHLFTTKPVGKGTGLGLSIARQIVVEKHGGTLTCKSEVGKGTEFAIALPIG